MQLYSFTPRVFRFSCKELKKRRGNGNEKYMINDKKIIIIISVVHVRFIHFV